VNAPYQVWDPSADDAFVCQAVRSVAPDVKTVVLAPGRPSAVRFEAGQYVTIEFDIDGTPVNRCYTIASPPTRPERIAITVKRTGRGTVSSWLHDGGLAAGGVVRVGEPQGSFTLAAHPAPSYLLLTAGSGITPALSILRTLYDLGTDRDVVLVHSQRHPGDVPYRDELDWMARHLPGLRIHYLCREVDSDDPAARVVAGRLGPDVLAELVPDAAAREVLACGPAPYRAAARAAVGGAPERFHEESFTFQAVDQVTPDARPAGGFRVEFRDHGTTVDCPPDTTLLAAAEAAGLTLPSSCAQGLCGTCKSTLVSGQVDMRANGGIRPREVAAGRVLLCCSWPLTDLVVTG
jgi:ferredoxin-NADP reductase